MNCKALQLAALLGLVVAAKWLVISLFGSPLPYWDQWGTESDLLVGWVEGNFQWQELASAHNEHRLLVSRLFWLLVFIANECQWDPQVSQYLAAIVTALTVLVAVACYLSRAEWVRGRSVIAAAAVLYALPVAWMNLVWGFQAQFHFQLLFSVLAICGLSTFHVRAWQWWGGLGAGVLALFTSGSGVLFAAGILGIVVIRWISRRSLASGVVATIAALGLLLVAAWLLLPKNSAGSRLAAQGPGDFLVAAMQHFSWPWTDVWPFALLIYLPSCLLLVHYLRSPENSARSAEFSLMLVGMAAAQLLAMSWARGLDGLGPHPRYADIHVLGVLANLLCLAELLRINFKQNHYRVAVQWLMRAWVVIVAAGIIYLALDALTVRLPQWSAELQTMRGNVQAYLDSGDESHLRGKLRKEIPVQEPEWLIEPLASESMREILPYIIRAPLATGQVQLAGVFQRNGPLPVNSGERNAAGDYYSSYAEGGGLGEFTSGRLQSRYSFLLFDYAGHASSSNIMLCVEGGSGEKQNCLSISDSTPAGRSWRRAVIPTVAGDFYLRAVDDRPGGWLAFSQPVECGVLTLAALRYADMAALVLAIAVAVFILALLLTPSHAMACSDNQSKE